MSCPGDSYLRYGGNTSCLEVHCGDKLLIFDAGTGLRPLGKQLCQNGALEADIFLTHKHPDHIVGLPFFASRSEEHTSELQSLMRNSYAVFCFIKNITHT